jgi:hypothetical protein
VVQNGTRLDAELAGATPLAQAYSSLPHQTVTHGTLEYIRTDLCSQGKILYAGSTEPMHAPLARLMERHVPFVRDVQTTDRQVAIRPQPNMSIFLPPPLKLVCCDATDHLCSFLSCTPGVSDDTPSIRTAELMYFFIKMYRPTNAQVDTARLVMQDLRTDTAEVRT